MAYLLSGDAKYCKYTHTSAVDCTTNPPSWGTVVSTKEFTPCAVCPVSEEQPWTIEVDSEGNCVATKIECVGPCDPACCPDPPSQDPPGISIPSSCCSPQCYRLWNITYDPVSAAWGTAEIVDSDCIDHGNDCPPSGSGIDPIDFPSNTWRHKAGCVFELWECGGDCELVADCAIPPTMPDPSEPPPECDCNVDMEQYTCTGSGDTCASPTKGPDYTAYTESTCEASGDDCTSRTRQPDYDSFTYGSAPNCVEFGNNCSNLSQQAAYAAAPATGPGLGTFTINGLASDASPVYYDYAMLGCTLGRLQLETTHYPPNGDSTGPDLDQPPSVQVSNLGGVSGHFQSAGAVDLFSPVSARWVTTVEVTYAQSPLGTVQVKGSAYQ